MQRYATRETDVEHQRFEKSVFRGLSQDRSVSRERFAWSCGALSRLALRSPCHVSSSWEVELGPRHQHCIYVDSMLRLAIHTLSFLETEFVQ